MWLDDLPVLVVHQYHRHMKEAGDYAKDVVVYILAGVAVLVGILLMTYLSTMLVDWLSKRFDDPNVASSNVLTRFEQHDAAMAAAAAAASGTAHTPDGRSIEDYDRGSISRQANLWGLETTERELILQKIFPTMSFEYNIHEVPMEAPVNNEQICNDDTAVPPTDIEMSVMSSTKNATMTNDTSKTTSEELATTTESSTINPENASDATVDTEPHDDTNPNDHDMVIQDDTDHYRMCSICLTSYEPGVRVITGVQCQHMFHEACCQQWLLKHDHCPFCRKNMILATDFRNAAVQALSPERIAELSVIPTTTQRQPPPPNRIIVLSS